MDLLSMVTYYNKDTPILRQGMRFQDRYYCRPLATSTTLQYLFRLEEYFLQFVGIVKHSTSCTDSHESTRKKHTRPVDIIFAVN